MKRMTIIILALSLMIVAFFAMPLIKPFLPDYKGIVVHEEKNDFLMTSQTIDESIVMSPWEVYQDQLSQWKEDMMIQEIFSKNLDSVIHELGMSDYSTTPSNMASAFQTYQNENQKAYFLKNYQYKDEKGQSFLLNIAWAQLDDYISVYFHIVPHDSSSQDQTNTITNQEIIDANNELKSFYVVSQPYDTEIGSYDEKRNPFEIIQFSFYDFLNCIHETNTVNEDFYQLSEIWNLGEYRSVVYENELLLDFQSYMPNSQLMLFYNVKKSCFSGFSIKMMI